MTEIVHVPVRSSGPKMYVPQLAANDQLEIGDPRGQHGQAV